MKTRRAPINPTKDDSQLIWEAYTPSKVVQKIIAPVRQKGKVFGVYGLDADGRASTGWITFLVAKDKNYAREAYGKTRDDFYWDVDEISRSHAKELMEGFRAEVEENTKLLSRLQAALKSQS